MKKFSLALLAVAAALAITPAALADTLYARILALTGGLVGTSPTLPWPNGNGSTGTAVTMSITNDQNEAKLMVSHGYRLSDWPTIEIPGINASVSI